MSAHRRFHGWQQHDQHQAIGRGGAGRAYSNAPSKSTRHRLPFNRRYAPVSCPYGHWRDVERRATNSALSSAFGLCARLCGRTAKEGARSGTYFAAPDRPQNARIDRPPPVFLLASVASISPRLCRAFRNGHYTALTTFPRRARNTEILILVLRSQGVHVWSRQRAA